MQSSSSNQGQKNDRKPKKNKKQQQQTTQLTEAERNQQHINKLYEQRDFHQQQAQMQQNDYISACSEQISEQSQNFDDQLKELETLAFNGNIDRVTEILENSPQKKITKRYLNTAMRAAIKGCNTQKLEDTIQCLECLIQYGANVKAEDADEGKTVLMLACEKGYLEVISKLIDSGAVINKSDKKKKTALMYAVNSSQENCDIVSELLTREADVNYKSLDGQTPLLLAGEKKHSKIVLMLLQHGADIRQTCAESGNSVLHQACQKGDLKTVQAILEYCSSTKQASESELQDLLFQQNRNEKKPIDLASTDEIRNLLQEKINEYEQKTDSTIQTLIQKQNQEKTKIAQLDLSKQAKKKKQQEAMVQQEQEEEEDRSDEMDFSPRQEKQQTQVVEGVETSEEENFKSARGNSSENQEAVAPIQSIEDEFEIIESKKSQNKEKQQEYRDQTKQKQNKAVQQVQPTIQPQTQKKEAVQAPQNHKQMIGAAPQPLPKPFLNQKNLPLTFILDISSEKAQNNFIINQQEQQINDLKQQNILLQQERDKIIRENQRVVALNGELFNCTQSQFNQANTYHENFKSLEKEFNRLQQSTQIAINQCFTQLQKAKKAAQSEDNSSNQGKRKNQKQNNESLFLKEMETALNQVQSVLQECKIEIGTIQEDGFEIKEQHEYRTSNHQQTLQSNQAREEVTGSMVNITVPTVKNLLIELEEQFETQTKQNSLSNPAMNEDYLNADEVYRKLSEEILTFRRDVRQILDETTPIKNEVVGRISQVLTTNLQNVSVDVFGSHATQLCLHWSDIDLVVIPTQPNQAPYRAQNLPQCTNRYVPPSPRSQNQQQQPSCFNGRHLLLEQVYEELKKEEHRQWIHKVQFIENTTVPVIKLECLLYPADKDESPLQKLFNLPAKADLQFPEILSKPVKIDITQMTDSHNGLQGVNLVKEYLRENQLIEPLILVLKQMLKVWGFNDPFTGGLSSYAVFLLIVSFLQAKQISTDLSQVNIGQVLLEFLKYYAELDVKKFAIACSHPGQTNSRLNIYPAMEVETYQNAFEKSSQIPVSSQHATDEKTAGLIQPSIIPMPQGTHVHHDQHQQYQNYIQYLPNFNPQPDSYYQGPQQQSHFQLMNLSDQRNVMSNINLHYQNPHIIQDPNFAGAALLQSLLGSVNQLKQPR